MTAMIRGEHGWFSTVWPPERLAQALCLVDRGWTYSQTAAALGTTKNAIAGIINRRRPGLPPTPQSLEERLGWDRVKQTGCRWIEGDPSGDWHWCGAAALDGRDYCAEHQSRMYLRHKEAA